MMSVHDTIRTMREFNQWTQEDMAEKLNISVNGYSKIERGKSKLTLEKLEQIGISLTLTFLIFTPLKKKDFFVYLVKIVKTIQISMPILMQSSLKMKNYHS